MGRPLVTCPVFHATGCLDAHVATIMVVHAMFATILAADPCYEGKSLPPVKLSKISRTIY